MRVIRELYVVPDGDQFILYAPLKRTVLRVNKSIILLLRKIRNNEEITINEAFTESIDHLRELGIIDGDEEYPSDLSTKSDYRPTSATFLPTSDCNLRCIYCYADSGITSESLPFYIAEAAVDLILKNAKENNIDRVQIGFLGGGEPFLKWQLMKDIVDYCTGKAGEFGIATFFSGVTNGLLTEEQVAWVTDNFQYLNISLDGTREIQDRHRPTKNHKGSYDTVMKTVKMLKSSGFSFTIRSTISSLSVDKMVQIVDFFANELEVSKIHLEPLFSCGRARDKSELTPDAETFISNFKKCLDLVDTAKTELFCSAIRLDMLTSRFCGALDQNFYITPDGYVTSCTEVSSNNDPLAEKFFIGKYDEHRKGFVFWNDKRDLLLSREVTNISHCNKCIAKWHCAGACPIKADYFGDIFDPSPLVNCEIARKLTEHYVLSLANGQDSLSPRIRANEHRFLGQSS